MSKYKILWIDDKWEEMDSFKEVCELPENKMEIIPCKYSVVGMAIFESQLEEWAGVILDAKVLMDETSQLDQLKGLNYSIRRIEQLSSKRKVPYYIFTGQPDTRSGTSFAEEHSENYYEKDKDEDRLIADIKRNAEKMLDIQITSKYHDIFAWYPNKSEMKQILSYLELDIYKDPAVFNLIRKELDWIMKYCYECGVSLVEFNGSNLSECSSFLGKKQLQAYVPEFIQRSLHSATTIANNGSHRLIVDDKVKKGDAPYLVRSTIFELLNIIMWAKNLPVEAPVRALLKADIQKLTQYS